MAKYYTMKIRFLIAVLCSIIMFSCKQNKVKDPFANIEEEIINEETIDIDPETMENIVQNISSPVEIAQLIKSLEVPFSRGILASTDYSDSYNTSFQKAIGLGIYGTDLGYLNMYNKTGSAVEYLASIKRLADGVKVGQFFDFNLLKRLATNSENLDSLVYISVHSFNEMDSYLRKNKRGNLSTLMITGGWLEGLYLATQVAAQSPHPDLAKAIGEQKTILGELLLILNAYKKDPKVADLIEDMLEIKKVYDKVKITYEVGEPESVEIDGMLVIIQNEKSVVHMTDDVLNEIIETTKKIRNKIIKS